MASIRPLRTQAPTYRFRDVGQGQGSAALAGALAAAAARGTLVRVPAPGAKQDAAADMRVLHIGCGSASPSRLHPLFRQDGWREIRVDVDEDVQPDIVASIVALENCVGSDTCDAVWASHVIEHVDTHAVPRALEEIRRVLRPTGFALMRCPDIEQVAQFILDGKLNHVIYNSAAGPITPLDMIYGHSASIARGHDAMRHGTAFTEASLAAALLEAGFAEVRTVRTEQFEIWAAAFREDAPVEEHLERLAHVGTVLRQ